MNEYFFILFLYLLGIVSLFSFRQKIAEKILITLALPFGLGILGLVSITMVLCHIRYNLVNLLGLLFVIGCCGFYFSFIKSKVKIVEKKFLFLYSIFFMLFTYIAIEFNYSVLSFDSIALVSHGKQLALAGYMQGDNATALSSWGFLSLAVQAVGKLIDTEYIYSLYPIMALNFCFLFYQVTTTIIKKTLNLNMLLTSLLTILCLFSFMTVYFMIFQFVYIHNSLLSSFYLFAALTMLYLYQIEIKKQWLHLGFCMLFCFAILRTESTLFIFLFSCYFLLDKKASDLKAPLLVLSVVLLSWYLKIVSVSAKGEIVTPIRGLMVIVPIVLLTLIICFVKLDRFKNLMKYSSIFILMGLLGVLAALFVLEYDHMLVSLDVSRINMFIYGRWGYVWHVMLALFAGSFLFKTKVDLNAFRYSIISFFLLVLILVYLRTPYRLGWGDSANRIFTHILPVLGFYNLLAYVSFSSFRFIPFNFKNLKRDSK